MDRLKTLSRKVLDRVKKGLNRLKRRYGPRYTNVMACAAFVAVFMPIPGSVLLTVALIVLIAEVHRAISRSSDLHDSGRGRKARQLRTANYFRTKLAIGDCEQRMGPIILGTHITKNRTERHEELKQLAATPDGIDKLYWILTRDFIPFSKLPIGTLMIEAILDHEYMEKQ